MAHTKEPLPDMRAMLPRLANQTILFPGDSMIRIQYLALAALVWEADNSCINETMFIHSRRWDFTVIYQSSVHILGVGYSQLGDNLTSKNLSSSIVNKLSGERYPFGHRVPNILLLSTGHHWSRGKYMKSVPPGQGMKSDPKILRAAVARSNTLLRPFSTRTRIIWTSEPARHYMSGEWNSGGSCSRTEPYTAEDIVYHLAYDSDFPSFQNVQPSAIIREEARASGFEYVDILPHSVLRSDGLVGALHPDKDIRDCTHYCIPGVPDVCNSVFLNHILSRSLVKTGPLTLNT